MQEGGDTSNNAPTGEPATTPPQEEAPPSTAEEPLAEQAEQAEQGGGGWGWGFASLATSALGKLQEQVNEVAAGGVMNKLRETSNAVLETYKHDLAEFATTIKGDTEKALEETKETISHVDAKEAVKGVVHKLEALDVGAAMRGITTVVNKTEEFLFQHGEPEVPESPSYNRLQQAVEALQADARTYTEEPVATSTYTAWVQAFQLADHVDTMHVLLATAPQVRAHHEALVGGGCVSEVVFWRRLLFLTHELEAKEAARVSMVKSMVDGGDEEELGGWGSDEDEDEGGVAAVAVVVPPCVAADEGKGMGASTPLPVVGDDDEELGGWDDDDDEEGQQQKAKEEGEEAKEEAAKVVEEKQAVVEKQVVVEEQAVVEEKKEPVVEEKKETVVEEKKETVVEEQAVVEQAVAEAETKKKPDPSPVSDGSMASWASEDFSDVPAAAAPLAVATPATPPTSKPPTTAPGSAALARLDDLLKTAASPAKPLIPTTTDDDLDDWDSWE